MGLLVHDNISLIGEQLKDDLHEAQVLLTSLILWLHYKCFEVIKPTLANSPL